MAKRHSAERIDLTEESRSILCTHIEETGNISEACRLIGITVRELVKLRKDHILLDEQVQMAQDLAADVLEREARRRAIDGVDEPVFYQGEEVGHIRKYSDTLLKELLRANKPEKFRDRVDLNATGDISVVLHGYKDFQKPKTAEDNLNG